ncbi:fungal-specific transcription factor domain-containing protein [Aspergillus pseudotamarii]|uniref:Fungal-specific transcription factor domain-containing protein n=1 Tax=Aspergillus pseudotamarii TaxID=132259 RepID=A0A5N6T2M9_ASPPS|nr:fungal-specific transcription factor domain-containing protein [Aspergillus pseudotamarii]KAE8140557.1 fungal-specific transcription factor domain-containing protein [Aspergillus pseudotamarii]
MDNSTSGKAPSAAKDAGRPIKRRKVAVACDECRVRKIRCDGAQPVCGPCTRKADPSVQCIYTGKQKLAVQSYIATLESRLKLLSNPRHTPAKAPTSVEHESSGHVQESTLSYSPVSSFDAPVPTQFTPSSSVSENRHRLASCIPTNTNAVGGSPSASVCRSPSGRTAGYISGQAQTRQRADGVNAMMGAVEEERPTQGFFGSSSAASFMHQIKMAVDRRVTSPHRRTSDTILGVSHAPGLMSTRSEKPSSIQSYVLPPRKTADSLMGVYWSFVFPLYPLVDGIRLRAEYEKVWTGEPLESDESMLMCTFNVIFALACQLADFILPEEREASADAFFSRAKDLLQFNLWDTGSAALIQCLLLMAQYLQSTDSAHQCWIVTGLAIRNAQSLGLHLPQTIARLPSPQEQQLARKIWHGCVLMDRVISMTFGRPAMISKASCESVPLPATVDEEYIPTASGIEATQPADQPSVMAFYAKSLELYEIMNDILLSLYKTVPEESPEDMYDLYFNKETNQDVYTAATVLIAGYLCPAVLDEVTEAGITRSWNCALEILRKYQSYSTSARRCVAALEILYERVVSERPPSHETSASHPQQTTASNAVDDMSLGEGMNAIFVEGFDWLDFQDMSWLNSVPSNLH